MQGSSPALLSTCCCLFAAWLLMPSDLAAFLDWHKLWMCLQGNISTGYLQLECRLGSGERACCIYLLRDLCMWTSEWGSCKLTRCCGAP